MLRDNAVVLIAFLGSIGLHLIAIPILYKKNPPLVYLPPPKSTHLETPADEYPEIELGIDDSNESTLTWIGYEEYEEQRARFSKVEQAAMKIEADVARPVPTLIALTTIQQAIQPVKEMSIQFLEALKGVKLITPSNVPVLPQPSPKKIETKTVDIAVAPSPTEEVNDTPVDGNPSDRESTATSIIQFSEDQWMSGKPLAAHGIVLRPRKQELPNAWKSFYNSPDTLVAQMQINNSGKPMRVIILDSTGSRYLIQDIKSNLYRWRASGDQIDALNDEETLTITIQLLFR
ncbi:MAG: hypothetical protein ISR75_00580 [Phycisphaerales bacterium]|nr:hypothetical protein [Planctomycetota bacterium]MBL6996917.1 hypothetical protein [Phycisphaerales bacterium]